MIKYADDKDIGQFLLNIDDCLIEQELGTNMEDKVFFEAFYPNKYYLLEELVHFDYGESEFSNSSNILKKLICLHIMKITDCIMSYKLTPTDTNLKKIKQYGLPEDYFNKPLNHYAFKTSKDRISLEWYNGKKSSFEDLLETELPEASYLRELFNAIINTYKEYQFYYKIKGHKITKVNISEKDNQLIVSEEVFEVIADSNTLYGVNKQHGLKVKFNNVFSNFDNAVVNVQCTSFKNFHNKVVKLLSNKTSLKTCAWCNPVKGKYALCENCKQLQDNIAYIIAEKNAKFTEEEIQKEILTIANDDFENLSNLREKRKIYLQEKIGRILKYDKELNKYFDKLLNISFSQFI